MGTVVPGVLIVGAEATVRDYFRCADQSNPLYLQIAPTIKTPGTEYVLWFVVAGLSLTITDQYKSLFDKLITF